MAVIGDLAEFIRGVTFKSGDATSEPAGNSVAILRAGNIQDGRLLTDSDLVFLDRDKVSQKQMLRPGDFVMCTSSGSAAVLGKVARLSDPNFCGSAGAFCAIIRPKTELLGRYLLHWFSSPVFLRWRDSRAQGVNIQNLRASELSALSVDFPDEGEQRRIADILDQVDALRRKAVMAKSVADDFALSWYIKQYGDDLPDGNATLLGEMVDQARGISYGIVQRGPEVSGGIPVLRIGDIVSNSFAPKSLVHTSEDISGKYRRTVLSGGELVVGIRGTIGNVAVVPSSATGWNVSREIAVIPLVNAALSRLVQLAMLTPASQRFIKGNVKGIAQSGINLRDLRLLPIPVFGRDDIERSQGLLGVYDQLLSRSTDQMEYATQLQGSLANGFFA